MQTAAFGLLIVGDEILSGKRADKHMAKVIELLGQRGLELSYVHYVGDDPARIERQLAAAFASGDVVFSCGGIGATPDDHTRQCAAAALKVPLALHPDAQRSITERMQDMAREQGLPFEPERPENLHRLKMGEFPLGADIIPNPYNKIPGFSCAGQAGGRVYFVPGFPVMAWPMIEWVLDQHYADRFQPQAYTERSVIVYDAMESRLTPLMQRIEAEHPGVKVFSLPSVDHPVHGRHIELGVKGASVLVPLAWNTLSTGLHQIGSRLGPEMVRTR